MKLTRLELRASPGMSRGFVLDALAPGLNVIVGPNASGKSSLVRAVRALLWEEEAFRGDVRSAWEHDGGAFDLERETGLPPRWGAGLRRPALPDARFRRCFTLSIDDFLEDDATREEIAREIRRELSAGFDLRSVMRKERDFTPQRAMHRAGVLREAQKKVQEVQDKHRQLLSEERELEELEAHREEARQAQALRTRLLVAVELAEARAQDERLRLQLADFPPGMQGLRGDEGKRLRQFEQQIQSESQELERARAELEAERQAIAATRLEAPIPREGLEALQQRENRMRALEQELGQAGKQLAGAQARLEHAGRKLRALSAEDGASELGGADWEAFEGCLRERDAARSRLAEARARAHSLEGAQAPPTAAPRALYALALGLMLVGAALALAWNPLAWMLFGAGLALIALQLWRASQEAGLQALRAADRLRRDEADERQLRAAQDALDALCAGLGLNAELGSLSLQEIRARALEQAQAEAEVVSARAVEARAQAQLAEELERIARDLAVWGLEPAREVVELQRSRQELERRSTALAIARDRERAALEGTHKTEAKLAQQRAARESFLFESDLQGVDMLELERRLERHAEYEALSQQARAARQDVARFEERLAQQPELVALDLEGARAQLDEQERLLAGAEDVNKQIADIEARVNLARAGHDLEKALADEEREKQALADIREELLEGACASFLIESVQQEHRQQAEPDILRRASEFFGGFTSHSYSLTALSIEEQEGPGFGVREAEGGTKRIEQLSSGTLSQLQLALRLAVAQSLETDAQLPLFFDEALSNSDPLRFREIARSLGELVRGGRQIFFLSSDPDDARRLELALADSLLEPPRQFDLAELRGQAAAASSLEHAPLPEIPAPRPSESAREYGERLGVPRLDPFAGVDAQHLFYASTHDLAAMHALLAQRIETIGQARQLLEARAGGVLDDAQRAGFEARRAVIAAFFEAYKIGRGRPLRAEDLREGPIRGLKFLEDLVALNEEYGGDAKRLIVELERKPSERDERLKGFQKRKIEDLRQDLEQRGCFSPREALDAASASERVLTATTGWRERGLLEREDVLQLSNALAQWLGFE